MSGEEGIKNYTDYRPSGILEIINHVEDVAEKGKKHSQYNTGRIQEYERKNDDSHDISSPLNFTLILKNTSNIDNHNTTAERKHRR